MASGAGGATMGKYRRFIITSLYYYYGIHYLFILLRNKSFPDNRIYAVWEFTASQSSHKILF